MCYEIGIKWRCDHQWVGWILCRAPVEACLLQQNRRKLDSWAVDKKRWQNVKRTGTFLQPTWCCSPKCCNLKLDQHVAVVTAASDKWETTRDDATKRSHSAWQANLTSRYGYGLAFALHIERCVNCFVEGLGRAKSMCEEMGEDFLGDEPVVIVSKYIPERQKLEGIAELQDLYARIVERSGGIMGIDTSSIQHYYTVRDYIIRSFGMCKDGWPLPCKKKTNNPGTWRAILEQLRKAPEPSSHPLRSSTPSPFELVSRDAMPHLEQAAIMNEILNPQILAEIDATADQFEQVLFGQGCLKFYRDKLPDTELCSMVAMHLGLTLDFEARFLTWLAQVWNQRNQNQTLGASLQFLDTLQKKLRDIGEMLKFERNDLYKWVLSQPPPVKGQIGATALILTTELDGALQGVTSPPDARQRASALLAERQKLQQNALISEEEEFAMEDLLDTIEHGMDGSEPLANWEQMEQTLHGYYDSFRGDDRPPQPYMPLQPKP